MTKRLGMLFSIVLVALLTVPAVLWLRGVESENKLFGYVDKIPERPSDLVEGFFDKKTQAWAERYFDVHFGLRVELIRTFNEGIFRIFREMPRLKLYATPEAGLYSGMSLEHFNHEILRKRELEPRYAATAATLRKVQTLVEAQGKAFVVIVAASKPYVYPESLGNRLVAGGSENAPERAASFGRALEMAGVNVIEAAPLLRRFARETNVSMHPDSGVHWNYYAGCVVAEQLMDHVRARFPQAQTFDCGIPEYRSPHLADIDGLQLMNIWSGAGLMRDAPYPNVGQADTAAWRPSFVFVSDSFVTEITSALEQGQAYSRAVNSGYFQVREASENGVGWHMTHDIGGDLASMRTKLLDDIRGSDVVVLQMVDYNVPKAGYDFPEFMLRHLGATNAGASKVDKADGRAPASPAPAKVLRTLALVEPGNQFNPVLARSKTTLVANPEQLLGAASRQAWDVVVLLQKAERRRADMAAELEKRGYMIVADGEKGLMALPRGARSPAAIAMEWAPYGVEAGAKATLVGGVPEVASALPADVGFYSQELGFDRPTLIRAQFEGTVAGGEPRAAHLSLYAAKPVFNLRAGTYSAADEFFVIMPAQGDGKRFRLSFGLGGWTRGSGHLRLKTLAIQPLSLTDTAVKQAGLTR